MQHRFRQTKTLTSVKGGSYLKDKKMRNISLNKLIVLVILAFSVSPTIQAQEKIDEFVGVYSDTTIVRTLSKGKFLVYNRDGVYSSFTFVAEVSPEQTLRLEDYVFIKDFNIFGNMVYFCGYEASGQGTEAIVGYFNLSSFPATQVFYYIYPNAESFNKLDAYTIISPTMERHVVMTATVSSTQSCVVDAYPSSATQWTFRCDDMAPSTEVYDDVVVRDSTVSFSSRGVDTNGLPVVRIWHYTRPTTVGMTIFNTSLYKQIITYPVASSPIWMERCPNDKLAIAYGTNNNHELVVTSMYKVAGSPVILPFGTSGSWRPQDIKYNPNDNELEVMLTNEQTEERIFQFPSSVFANMVSPGDVYSHSFRTDVDRLSSFDFCPDENLFTVTGYKASDRTLCYYKYKYDEWADCSNKTQGKAFRLGFFGRNETDFLPGVFPVTRTISEMEVDKEETEHITVCQ